MEEKRDVTEEQTATEKRDTMEEAVYTRLCNGGASVKAALIWTEAEEMTRRAEVKPWTAEATSQTLISFIKNN